MGTQRPGPSSGWVAHTSARRRIMAEKIKEAEPRRWDMYMRKRRGNEDLAPGADLTPTGVSAPGGPASSTQVVQELSQRWGNEDPTPGIGITPTGAPESGDPASSTQRAQ